MAWEKPTFREVNMSSEIGAYQEDIDERKLGDTAQTGSPADHATVATHQADTRM